MWKSWSESKGVATGRAAGVGEPGAGGGFVSVWGRAWVIGGGDCPACRGSDVKCCAGDGEGKKDKWVTQRMQQRPRDVDIPPDAECLGEQSFSAAAIGLK